MTWFTLYLSFMFMGFGYSTHISHFFLIHTHISLWCSKHTVTTCWIFLCRNWPLTSCVESKGQSHQTWHVARSPLILSYSLLKSYFYFSYHKSYTKVHINRKEYGNIIVTIVKNNRSINQVLSMYNQ